MPKVATTIPAAISARSVVIFLLPSRYVCRNAGFC